jgi:hypothetical protein
MNKKHEETRRNKKEQEGTRRNKKEQEGTRIEIFIPVAIPVGLSCMSYTTN